MPVLPAGQSHPPGWTARGAVNGYSLCRFKVLRRLAHLPNLGVDHHSRSEDDRTADRRSRIGQSVQREVPSAGRCRPGLSVRTRNVMRGDSASGGNDWRPLAVATVPASGSEAGMDATLRIGDKCVTLETAEGQVPRRRGRARARPGTRRQGRSRMTQPTTVQRWCSATGTGCRSAAVPGTPGF